MKDFLNRQVNSFRQWLRSNPRLSLLPDKELPQLEKFLIAGPTLIGYLAGLLRYEPGSDHFEMGFQSLVLFWVYMLTLTILQMADSLFFSQWPIVLSACRSLLATGYLVLTLRQYLEWRRGTVRISGAVKRLRERLRPLIGDAA